MATQPRERIHVRLIDDDSADVARVVTALTDAGDATYVVDSCSTLAEHLATTTRFDVVVIDPTREDATDADLPTLIEHPPLTPAVVLTRNEAEDAKLSAVRAGAQDYLLKDTVTPAALSKALRFAIERKRARDLEDRLFRADRLLAVGQLAVGFAHEINNPATFMHAALELLADSADTISLGVTKLRAVIDRDAKPDVQAAVDEALQRTGVSMALADMQDLVSQTRDGLERIRAVTRNMQSFSRIERNTISAVKLNELVGVACALADNEIRHRAKLTTHLGDVPTFNGDAARLSQVVTHLLIHAAKTIEGGKASKHRIDVSTRADTDGIHLVIASTGRGMDAPTRARLFEVEGEASGLGLPVCKDIVTRHRGTIEASSQVGRGSQFTVTIPHDTGLAKSGGAVASPTPVDIAGARVLLVDDEDKVRLFMERSLGEVEFVLAPSGEDAIDVLKREHDFDAIVCDLMMPNGDGVDVYNHLAEHNRALATKMVFYTGGVLTPKAKQFAAHAPRDFLQKPVTPRELRWAIADVMGRV